jgi:CHAP domain
MLEPRPASAPEAVARARRLLTYPSNARNGYMLGTGDYRPRMTSTGLWDMPWSQTTDASGAIHTGSDCAGFALAWCYKLQRHRPGYNHGGAFYVEDDINSNSAIGDALGERDCFELATGAPRPGDLIAYPTFRLNGLVFIGHVAIVVGVSRVIAWDPKAPRYDQLDIVQVCGPNGRTPAAIATDGSVFAHHAATWPKPEHTCYLLRVVS